MTKREATIGTHVQTSMGCKRIGTITRIPAAHEWNDGTYRYPLNAREARMAVGVKWSDGTRGIANIIHLERI